MLSLPNLRISVIFFFSHQPCCQTPNPPMLWCCLGLCLRLRAADFLGLSLCTDRKSRMAIHKKGLPDMQIIMAGASQGRNKASLRWRICELRDKHMQEAIPMMERLTKSILLFSPLTQVSIRGCKYWMTILDNAVYCGNTRRHD